MIELDDQRFITAAEAPDHLGDDIKPAMVRDWGRRRLVQGYRVGGSTYYALADLIEVELILRTGGLGRPRQVA